MHVLSTHNSRPLYFTVRNQSPSFVVFSPLGVPATLERGRQIYLHEKVEGIICLFHSVDTSVMVEKRWWVRPRCLGKNQGSGTGLDQGHWFLHHHDGTEQTLPVSLRNVIDKSKTIN